MFNTLDKVKLIDRSVRANGKDREEICVYLKFHNKAQGTTDWNKILSDIFIANRPYCLPEKLQPAEYFLQSSNLEFVVVPSVQEKQQVGSITKVDLYCKICSRQAINDITFVAHFRNASIMADYLEHRLGRIKQLQILLEKATSVEVLIRNVPATILERVTPAVPTETTTQTYPESIREQGIGYYLLNSKGTHPPKFAHGTYQSAIAEAERLTKQVVPGSKTLVLQPIAHVEFVQHPAVKIRSIEELLQEHNLPF